jgi:hypothetical protein
VIDPARKTAELRAHVNSLDRELTRWIEEADGKRKPLRRHFTQIGAISGTLRELAEQVLEDLDGPQGDWIFETAPDVERHVLDLHRLWGFFRDKLALRYATPFADALLVADDLAWACYEPAQQFIPAGRRREPPLVYFSSGATPFLMPRGTPYVVEPLPDGKHRAPPFAKLVDGMPIALVGLPWFEVEYVPDLPVIAHEVGHAVESDLGLEAAVEALLLGAVNPEHVDAWRAWRQEVFADLYGVLALGPSYAATLSALLATHPRDVVDETARKGDEWGSYPTRTLRVLLVACALDTIGFTVEAKQVACEWRAVYETHKYPAFEQDVGPAIRALLNTKYPLLGCKPLTDILCFGSTEQTETALVKGQLAKGFAPNAAEHIRPLVAGARLAHQDPERGYDVLKAADLVRKRAAKIQTLGRRTAHAAPEAPAPELLAERNRQAGRRLADLLKEESPDVQAQQA